MTPVKATVRLQDVLDRAKSLTEAKKRFKSAHKSTQGLEMMNNTMINHQTSAFPTPLRDSPTKSLTVTQSIEDGSEKRKRGRPKGSFKSANK